MRTGILLACGTGVTADFEALIARARMAEQAGYSSVWLGEHHFDAARPEPVPLVLAGALAAETADIRLGVMVKPALEHPLKVAEDAAVVDVLSGGRLLFGADPIAGEEETAAYGVAGRERQAYFEEALDIIMQAWSGDAFAYRGRYHTLPGRTRAARQGTARHLAEPYAPPYVDPWLRSGRPFDYLSVLPKPAQIPHPPVFIVARDEASTTFAAQHGYSPIFLPGPLLDDLPGRATAFWRALEAAGHRRPEVLLTLAGEVCVHDGRPPACLGRAAGGSILAGTPPEVVHHIKALQRDSGLGQILCRFDLPGITPEQAARGVELFASEVRPRLEM